jgi:hypothetical protein
VADKEGPSVIDLCCTLFLKLFAKHPIFATPTPVGASTTWSFGVELLHWSFGVDSDFCVNK